MICPKCGTENSMGMAFCKFCGTQLSGFKENTYKVDKKERKRKNTTIVFLLFFLVVIVGALGYGYYYFSNYYKEAATLDRICSAILNHDETALQKEVLSNSKYQTKDKLIGLTISNSCSFQDNKMILKDASYEYKVVEAGKKFWLFPNLQIDFIDFSIEEWVIKVPSNSLLKVEDILLTKNSRDENYDIYVLHDLYKATYKVEVEHPDLKTVSDYIFAGTEVQINYELNDDLSFLENFFELTYGFSFQGTAFNSLKPYITETLEKQFLLEVDYLKQGVKELLSQHMGYEVNTLNFVYQGFDVKNVIVSDVMIDENGMITANITYDYTMTFIDMQDRSDTVQTLNNHTSLKIQLQKIDGNFKIHTIRV